MHSLPRAHCHTDRNTQLCALPHFNIDLLLNQHQEKKNNVLYLKVYNGLFIILKLNSFLWLTRPLYIVGDAG